MDLGDDPYIWACFQGRLFVKLARYAAAVDQYSEAIALSPDEYGPYKARAVAHLCEQDYVESVNDFSTAVALQGPDSTWIRYARATPLWILGRTTEAAADNRWVCAHHDRVSHANIRLFLVLHDQARQLDEDGRPSDAEDARREAANVLATAQQRVEPGSRLATFIECLAGSTQPEELVASADPSDLVDVCKSNYYAGEVSLLHGHIDDAIAYFRNSVNTGLVMQPNSTSGDPMNEWHLARWRLAGLGDLPTPSTRPVGP